MNDKKKAEIRAMIIEEVEVALARHGIGEREEPEEPEELYYTPEPGEDPHLPPGTPCEARNWDGEDWEEKIYIGWDKCRDYEYVVNDTCVNQIRFRLSDIQDREEKMVGKMVIAWNPREGFRVGYCKRQCEDGRYFVIVKDGCGYYAHTRLYCGGWE